MLPVYSKISYYLYLLSSHCHSTDMTESDEDALRIPDVVSSILFKGRDPKPLHNYCVAVWSPSL